MTVPSQPPPLLPPRQSSRHLPLIVSLSVAGAAATVLIVLVVVGVVVLMAQPNIEGLIDHGGTTADKAGEAVVQVEDPGFDPEEILRRNEKHQQKAAKEEEQKRKKLLAGPTTDDNPTPKKPPKVAKKPKPKPSPDKRDPLADIKDRGNFLLLPANNATDLLAAKSPKRLLATLYTDDQSSCRLKLGAGFAGTDQRLYFLKEKSTEDKRIRSWSVIRAPKKDRGVGDNQDVGTQIAVFELERKRSTRGGGQFEQALTFRWAKGVREKEPEIVQLMNLVIGVGKHTASCELARPLELESIAIKFDGKKELGPNLEDAEAQLSQSQDKMFLDLKLKGFEAGALVSRKRSDAETSVTKNVGEASQLLTGIPVNQEITIIVRRKWINKPLNALVVTVGFKGVSLGKRVAQVRVGWHCLLPAIRSTGASVVKASGYKISEAKKSLTRVAASTNLCMRKLNEANEELRTNERLVAEYRKQLDGLLNPNQKIKVTRQLVAAQKGIRPVSTVISLHRSQLAYLKAASPYVIDLYDAMGRHHGRSTIEWRIYLSKAGKSKTLAVSEKWSNRNGGKR